VLAEGDRGGERLRILQVAAAGPYGGLESMLALLAAGLTRRHHDLRVAAVLDPGPEPHPFESLLRRYGVAVIALRLPPRAYRRERRALRELMLDARPDVVHTHGYRADVQAGAVARRLGVATVATVHGFTGGAWRNHLYEWLQQRSLRRSDAVVAVSRPLVERLRRGGVEASRLHLLLNAWGGRGAARERDEARGRLGLPRDAFVIGWVGRLSHEKGADVLLEALARTRERAGLACVIGDGPERAALEARAGQLGLASRVRWCGAVPDAGSLFAAFDVFALSSRTEGTPMVLFEAMEAGVPIVATAVGGVPDVVGDDEAWLVPPEDPGELSRALDAARVDLGAAERKVEASRRRLTARFGLDPWLDAYERIYAQVIASGHSTPQPVA